LPVDFPQRQIPSTFLVLHLEKFEISFLPLAVLSGIPTGIRKAI